MDKKTDMLGITMIRLVVLSTYILVISIGLGYSQSSYFAPKTIKKGPDFSFSIFSHPGGRAATRINRLLQLGELYALAKPPYSSRIFSQAESNDGSIYGGKVSMQTTIYSNNDRILSVGFVETSSGATMHYWNKYYTFNSGNGDRIALKDLFSSSDYKTFFNVVVKKRTLKYKREVRKKVEPQLQDAYLETIGCFESDDVPDFYIRGGSIVIDGDSCLIKGQKFDGLKMEVAFSLNSFRKYLNSYGKTVFGLLDADISRFRSSELPQLFEGSVGGSYDFAMILSPDWSDEYWGMYAYLKYGEGIALRGKRTDDQLALTEYILSPIAVDGPMGLIKKTQEQGTVSGRLEKGTFEGIWKDKEGTKDLPFAASIR